MNIKLNGNITSVKQDATVIDVIRTLDGLSEKGIVTLLNDEIIKSGERELTILKENDSLEIIIFVSGG